MNNIPNFTVYLTNFYCFLVSIKIDKSIYLYICHCFPLFLLFLWFMQLQTLKRDLEYFEIINTILTTQVGYVINCCEGKCFFCKVCSVSFKRKSSTFTSTTQLLYFKITIFGFNYGLFGYINA